MIAAVAESAATTKWRDEPKTANPTSGSSSVIESVTTGMPECGIARTCGKLIDARFTPAGNRAAPGGDRMAADPKIASAASRQFSHLSAPKVFRPVVDVWLSAARNPANRAPSEGYHRAARGSNTIPHCRSVRDIAEARRFYGKVLVAAKAQQRAVGRLQSSTAISLSAI